MKPLNIIFAGTPDFALPSLKALCESQHTVQAVYTQPDRPAGRGKKNQASPIKLYASEQNIPVFQPEKLSGPSVLSPLEDMHPDLMVVIAYGLILPSRVLAIPKYGCINVHASLLPRWRGASPIQQAILKGDDKTGITVMQMDKGMDTGDILSTVALPLTGQETSESLHNQLMELAIQPLLETIDKIASHSAHPVSQNQDLATYAPKIKKTDAMINWQQSAQKIDCMIRAYQPWPGAFTFVGETPLKIIQAQLYMENHSQPPGTILEIDKEGMKVACQEGCILVQKIQFPGRKIVAISDWMNTGKSTLHPGFTFSNP